MPRTLLLVALMIACGAPLACARQLSHDDFGNGPRDDLHGSNGGTGWSGAWIDIGSTITTSITPEGLGFAGLAVSGGSALTPGGWLPDMTDYTRAYPAIVGDSMFVSCLLRAEPDQSNWYILRFGTYPRQVDMGIPIGYFEYGFMLGDGLIVTSGVPSDIGATNFLVLEVTHDRANNRTLYSMYVDPTPGEPKPPHPDASYGRMGILPFGTSVELRGEGGYSLDELRIGTSWEGVTPASAPPCMADVDGNGTLDIFDFLAFQTLFSEGDLAADFTGDGRLNVFDFLAFQTLFEIGC